MWYNLDACSKVSIKSVSSNYIHKEGLIKNKAPILEETRTSIQILTIKEHNWKKIYDSLLHPNESSDNW